MEIQCPNLVTDSGFFIGMSDSESKFANLFPLPLTSIETFHWFDQSPAFPNYIFSRLDFDVEIDADLARSAWETIIVRHPLGQVVPERTRSGRLVWTQRDESGLLERCFTVAASGRPGSGEVQFPAPDHLTAPQLCLQTWMESSQPRSRLTFCIHHAICDGLGGIYAVNEWLIAYNNLLAGREPDAGLRQIEPQRIHRRNELGMKKWAYWKHLPKQPVALFGASKFVFRKTASLVDHQDDPPADSSSPSHRSKLIGVWMSEPETEQIYQQANRWGITSNHLLLGNLFRTLGNFRHRHQTGKQRIKTDREWMRVILPISIRNHADRRFPVSNRTSLVQIDRRWPGEKLEQHFLKMLQREVNIINRWQLDRTFLIAINAIAISHRLLQRVASNPKPRGLAVFTDLGQPWRLATKAERRSSDNHDQSPTPVLPYEFDLAGPIRQGTPLNFSFARHQDRLRISLHYDQQVIADEDAHWLLGDFRDGLLQFGSG